MGDEVAVTQPGGEDTGRGEEGWHIGVSARGAAAGPETDGVNSVIEIRRSHFEYGRVYSRCASFSHSNVGRRNATGGYGVLAGGANEEESPRRDRRDRTPERRPTRPKAIKSPMYARRGRSGEERYVQSRWC